MISTGFSYNQNEIIRKNDDKDKVEKGEEFTTILQ